MIALLCPAEFGRWDIVVSAPWLSGSRYAGLQYLVDELSAVLTPDQRLQINEISIQFDSSPIVEAITRIASVDHGLQEIGPTRLGPVDVERGFVITARPRAGN